jgi:hypothetical protein
MNNSIKSMIIFSLALILFIPFINATSLYYVASNETTLKTYNIDTTAQLTINNALYQPNSLCTNNDGNLLLIGQGNYYTTPSLSKFYENGIFYTYYPYAENEDCNINNNIISLISRFTILSQPYGNISLFNTLTNEYYAHNIVGNGIGQVCSNTNGSLIAFMDNQPTFGLIKNFNINSTTYERRGTLSGQVCSISDNDLIYLMNGTQLRYMNLSTSSNTSYLLNTFLSDTIINMKLVNNILYLVSYNRVYYDDVSDNNFNTSTYFNIGCNSTQYYGSSSFKALSCFDVSSNNGYVALINNSKIMVSKDYGNTFTDTNIYATALSIYGSTETNATPKCIDNYNLCNIPIGAYCDVLNVQYCSLGCINSYINGNLQGACNNTLCTDECVINGYTECDSTTSFKVCGNYDTDPCLEYNTGYGCMSGQVCRNGACTSNTGTGIKNNTAFTVTPYSVNSESTKYVLDSQNKKVSVGTKNYIQVQGFSTNTNLNNSYTSRTCEYKEEQQYIQTSEIINLSTTYNFNAIGTTSHITINLTPQDNINVTISVSDSIGNIILTNHLLRNISNKELCIYSENYTLMYCDYSVNSYDDLKSVILDYDFEYQSKVYTLKTYFDRAQPNSKTFYQIVFTNNDYSSINITSNNVTLNQIKIFTYTQPKGFSTTLKNNYDYLSCTYSTIGCNVVRTYNNIDGLADFTNYYDYTVCITGVALDTTQLNNSDTRVYTTQEKTLYSFLVILFSIIVLSIIPALFGADGGLIALCSVSGIILGCIFSGLLGFMSIGVIMIISIIDAGIIAVMVKKIFFQSS